MVYIDISYSHMTVKQNAFISVIEWPRIPALIPKENIQIHIMKVGGYYLSVVTRMFSNTSI